MTAQRMVVDGLMNALTGMGVPGTDRRLASTWAVPVRTTSELGSAYRASWLARAAVDMPVADAFADGRNWQGTADEITALEAEERRLGFRAKLIEAKCRGRLYGGAALFIDDKATDTALPFDPSRVGRGGLRTITVLDLSELSAGETDKDITSPGYGRPGMWTLNGTTTMLRIHPSRLVFFGGSHRMETSTLGRDGIWTDSVLADKLDAIRDAEAVFSNIAALTDEANVDIVGIPNLTGTVADPEGEKAIRARIGMARQLKSIHRMLVQDAEETYDRKAISFGSLPDVLREAYQLAAGAIGIPATRLLGRAPAGMNATGDGDERVYFDRLDTMRGETGEALTPLDEAMIRSALGRRPEELHYTWPDLRQLSAKDRADIGDKIASKWEKIANLGVYGQEEIRAASANDLIEAGCAPGLEAAMAETAEAGLGFEEGDEPEDDDPAALGDAAPRTLYVRRDVLNGAEILAWAKEQGFTKTLPADDLHVTITYSRTPVDWMKMGEPWAGKLEIEPGGPRLMEAFGEAGDAKVLLFTSNELRWRHERMVEEGASWDHDEYQPHITISYDPDAPGIAAIKPYQGRIVLGPEIFEELDPDWKAKVTAE